MNSYARSQQSVLQDPPFLPVTIRRDQEEGGSVFKSEDDGFDPETLNTYGTRVLKRNNDIDVVESSKEERLNIALSPRVPPLWVDMI